MLFSKSAPLLSTAIQDQVVAAIRIAEARTTGELRVFVEKHCAYMDPLDRAKEVFSELGMEKTERRNAVLVYIALKDHQFAIFGDREIYEKAGGPVFWETAARVLRQYLREDKIGDGIAACIDSLGTALATHFPYDPAVQKNELPDEIVFGK
jgi:uncharacterized membrane protein